jgi:hypothetical protein
LQDFLVEELLLKIIWCQYANVASQSLTEDSSPDQDSAKAVTVSAHLQPVLPPQVSDEVASTIVDILILLGQEKDVLDAFWPGFQTACVGVLLDTSSENDARLARLGSFFSVLDVKIPEKEKPKHTWLLLNVVQPFVAKGFPALKNSVSLFCFLSMNCYFLTILGGVLLNAYNVVYWGRARERVHSV